MLFGVGLSAQSGQPVHTAPVQQGYRIAGVVVNWANGQPVAGASVAIAPVTQGGERDISRSMTTGADGGFSFAGLGRGKYSLMATAHGFTLQGFERHGEYATAIVAGPDLDSEHLVFRLQPDASVEGIVTDENNDPVEHAMVRLFEQSTEDGRQKTIPMGHEQTDDQGQFRIGHLEPGTYYLAVSARPWYAQNESRDSAPEIEQSRRRGPSGARGRCAGRDLPAHLLSRFAGFSRARVRSCYIRVSGLRRTWSCVPCRRFISRSAPAVRAARAIPGCSRLRECRSVSSMAT